MEINASIEWLNFCVIQLRNAKKNACKKVYDKFGNETPFPMFLHIDLCDSLRQIFACAPHNEEALDFINHALNEVKEEFKDKIKKEEEND